MAYFQYYFCFCNGNAVSLCVEYGLFYGSADIVGEIVYLEEMRPHQPDLVLQPCGFRILHMSPFY